MRMPGGHRVGSLTCEVAAMNTPDSTSSRNFDGKTAFRATSSAVGAVGVLALVSMALLDHGDFVDWGWLIGPVAWVTSCLVGARVGGLSVVAGLAGAVVAGIPSARAPFTGLHRLGVVVGLAAFAAWTGSARARSL